MEETKAICFPSGDHAKSFPVPGSGELVPAERRQEGRAAAIGMRDQKAVPVAISTVERDPLAVAGPERAAGGLVTAEADALFRAQIHHPELAIRTAGAIAHGDRVGDVAAIGRERDAADGAQARKVAAGKALSADRRCAR